MKQQNKAALLAFLGGIVWSFSGLLSKLVPWSSFSLVGLRGIVATVILGLCRGSFSIRPNKAMWLNALGISITSLLYMSAIRLTNTANAIVLQYTAPVFVILYLFVIKKQMPRKSEVIGAAFVALGVILCFSGGIAKGNTLGNLLGLLSGVTYSVVFLSARASGNDPVDGVYLGTLISCVMLVTVPFDRSFRPDLNQLAVMLCLGTSLGLGYLFFSLGMRYGLSPLRSCVISNVEPVMNPVWVFLFLGESPGTASILGAAVVLLAVTGQSIYEAMKA